MGVTRGKCRCIVVFITVCCVVIIQLITTGLLNTGVVTTHAPTLPWRQTRDTIRRHTSSADVIRATVGTRMIPNWFAMSQETRNSLLRLNGTVDIALQYPTFTIKEPRFISAEERALFRLNKPNRRVGKTHRAQLKGNIKIIRDGSVHDSYDCGWNRDVRQYENSAGGVQRAEGTTVDFICPILVADGNSFQHFLDGVLPKIIQVQPLLMDGQVRLMLAAPKANIITEILRGLGIADRHVITYTGGHVTAPRMLNTCVTPPWHPLLWNALRSLPDASRSLLGASRSLRGASRNSHPAYVILLTRARARNPGRLMTNFRQVAGYLKSRYGEALRVFTGGYDLAKSATLFGSARLVIGVHGGAFYNIVLCRQGRPTI